MLAPVSFSRHPPAVHAVDIASQQPGLALEVGPFDANMKCTNIAVFSENDYRPKIVLQQKIFGINMKLETLHVSL